MCDTPSEYKHDDIVWVKLGFCWWPGAVIGIDQLVDSVKEELQTPTSKLPTIAIVKFFQEDSYEYVKKHDKIFPYNCQKKDEFIKKGMDLHKTKKSMMANFPEDVITAEQKTGGNEKILEDEKFTKPRVSIKQEIAGIFGSPKPSKTSPKPVGRQRSSLKGSSAKKSTYVTHPRFIGKNNDHQRIVLMQQKKEDQKENSFKCIICQFSSTRIDAMVLHNKIHLKSDPLFNDIRKKGKKKKGGKRVSKKSKIPTSKTNSIDEDLELLEKGMSLSGGEAGESTVPEKKKKRKRKRPAESTKEGTETDVKKAAPNITNDLLAEWDDMEDSEDMDDFDKSSSSLNQSLEASPTPIKEQQKVTKPKAQKLQTPKAQKSIVNVKAAKDNEKACFGTEEMKATESDTENETKHTEKPEVDFSALLETTKVPDLPQLPNVKSEDVKITPKSPEIATKLTNPKKRFVKSFEDFELSMREKELEKERDGDVRTNRDVYDIESEEEKVKDVSEVIAAEPVIPPKPEISDVKKSPRRSTRFDKEKLEEKLSTKETEIVADIKKDEAPIDKKLTRRSSARVEKDKPDESKAVIEKVVEVIPEIEKKVEIVEITPKKDVTEERKSTRRSSARGETEKVPEKQQIEEVHDTLEVEEKKETIDDKKKTRRSSIRIEKAKPEEPEKPIELRKSGRRGNFASPSKEVVVDEKKTEDKKTTLKSIKDDASVEESESEQSDDSGKALKLPKKDKEEVKKLKEDVKTSKIEVKSVKDEEKPKETQVKDKKEEEKPKMEEKAVKADEKVPKKDSAATQELNKIVKKDLKLAEPDKTEKKSEAKEKPKPKEKILTEIDVFGSLRAQENEKYKKKQEDGTKRETRVSRSKSHSESTHEKADKADKADKRLVDSPKIGGKRSKKDGNSSDESQVNNGKTEETSPSPLISKMKNKLMNMLNTEPEKKLRTSSTRSFSNEDIAMADVKKTEDKKVSKTRRASHSLSNEDVEMETKKSNVYETSKHELKSKSLKEEEKKEIVKSPEVLRRHSLRNMMAIDKEDSVVVKPESKKVIVANFEEKVSPKIEEKKTTPKMVPTKAEIKATPPSKVEQKSGPKTYLRASRSEAKSLIPPTTNKIESKSTEPQSIEVTEKNIDIEKMLAEIEVPYVEPTPEPVPAAEAKSSEKKANDSKNVEKVVKDSAKEDKPAPSSPSIDIASILKTSTSIDWLQALPPHKKKPASTDDSPSQEEQEAIQDESELVIPPKVQSPIKEVVPPVQESLPIKENTAELETLPQKAQSPSKPTSSIKAPVSPVKTSASPIKTSASPIKTSASPIKTPTSPVKTPTSPVKAPLSPQKVSQSPAKPSSPIKEPISPTSVAKPAINQPSPVKTVTSPISTLSSTAKPTSPTKPTSPIKSPSSSKQQLSPMKSPPIILNKDALKFEQAKKVIKRDDDTTKTIIKSPRRISLTSQEVSIEKATDKVEITVNNNEDVDETVVENKSVEEDKDPLALLALVSSQNKDVIEKNVTVVPEDILAKGQVEIAKIIEDGTEKIATIPNVTLEKDNKTVADKSSVTESVTTETKSIVQQTIEETLSQQESTEVEKPTRIIAAVSTPQSPIILNSRMAAEQESTSKLLEILTDNKRTTRPTMPTKMQQVPLPKIATPKFDIDPKKPTLGPTANKPSGRILTSAPTSSGPSTSKTKPTILSDTLIRPADAVVSVQKVKRTYDDLEDIDTFIITKHAKKSPVDEDAKKSQTTKSKPKILEHTIITAAGQVIQPIKNVKKQPTIQQQTIKVASGSAKTVEEKVYDLLNSPKGKDEDAFDIDNMPIVLGDQLLTSDNIETMPVVVSEQGKQATQIIKKPVQQFKVAPKQQVAGVATAMKAATPPTKTFTKIVKDVKGQRFYQNPTPTLLKHQPTILATGKQGKFVVVPSQSSTPTGSKYTVGKRQIVKKQPTFLATTKSGQSIAGTEPTGNKIMIVTNNQGQQQRVLITPEQQKMMGYQTTVKKTVVKGSAMKSSPGSGLIALKKQKVEQPKPQQQQKVGQKFTLQGSLPHLKTAPGQTRTVIIKNQQGQIVNRIHGTSDEDIEKQVAEQLEAINRAASAKTKGGMPTVKRVIKKAVPAGLSDGSRVGIQNKAMGVSASALSASSRTAIPPLAPISPLRKISDQTQQKQLIRQTKIVTSTMTAPKPTSSTVAKAEIPTKLVEKPAAKEDRPPKQLVIQDAMGNETTIMEGQILALPSETVDGQPQSYMLVTLDESGSLTPLNNEALMSLDPNLNLGGDLSNMVLQIEGAGAGAEPESAAATSVAAPPEKPNIIAGVSKPAEVVKELQQETLIAARPDIPLEQPAVQAPADNLMEPDASTEQMQAITCRITKGDTQQQLIITGDPVATQKFLESLTEGNPDIANLLAQVEGSNILIHTDGQQILINTDADNQMLMSLNPDAEPIAESSVNSIFASQSSTKNQDILAAALADTDVFQQEQSISSAKIAQSQVSPGYSIGVNNVLETSTVNSPIMTPLEAPSNTKKIETDVLTQISKNVDLPITITDPNIAQSVSNQQVALMATELASSMELPLTIQDVPATSAGMNSPSFYSLSSLDDGEKFTSPISMPLLTEDPEEVQTSTTNVTQKEISDVSSQELQSDKSSQESTAEYLLATGEMCSMSNQMSSLSEPPPDMFDFPMEQAYETKQDGSQFCNTSEEVPIQSDIDVGDLLVSKSPKRGMEHDSVTDDANKRAKLD